MQQININELKPHPRNNEFFDDMTGEKWDEFLQSVKVRLDEYNSGKKDVKPIIEPIIVTTDMIIVSGHQRIRACKELGITTVECEIRKYNSENDILKDLIEINIRQRGDIGGSAKKTGKRLDELKRIYGIKQGGSGYYGNQFEVSPKNSETPITQEIIAKMNGMSVDTMENYITLSKMIPELDELVTTGIVTKTTALAMMRNLSNQEQKEFIDSIPTDKKYTQKQMDEEIQKYKNRISELVQQKIKTETVEIQVDKPETLTKIKDLEEKLDKKTKENEKMSSTLIEKEKMINEAIGASTNYQLTSHCSEITLKMLNFVKEMAQYDYMAESFNEIPIATRIEYEKCIKSVKKWADRILGTINQEKEIIDM